MNRVLLLYILYLMIIALLVLIINLIICSLYFFSQETNTIIKNLRNFDLLCLGDSIKEDTKYYFKEVALSFTLNRISKIKLNFVINWYKDVDVVLLDFMCSARHYIVLINYKDVAIFYKQSKNNTIINEKIYKNYSIALYNKIKIEF